MEWEGAAAILQPSSSRSCPSDRPDNISHTPTHHHPSLANNRIWLAIPESFLHWDGLPTLHHEFPATVSFSSRLQEHTIFLIFPQGGPSLANTF